MAENDAGVAQKPTVQFIDDLDEAEETVSFVLDVTSYEIGLSAVHVAARGAVALRRRGQDPQEERGLSRRWARRAEGRGRRPPSSIDRQRSAEIRQWAREQFDPVVNHFGAPHGPGESPRVV